MQSTAIATAAVVYTRTSKRRIVRSESAGARLTRKKTASVTNSGLTRAAAK